MPGVCQLLADSVAGSEVIIALTPQNQHSSARFHVGRNAKSSGSRFTSPNSKELPEWSEAILASDKLVILDNSVNGNTVSLAKEDSLLALRLEWRGCLLGLIGLACQESRALDSDFQNLFTIYADDISSALYSLKIEHELRQNQTTAGIANSAAKSPTESIHEQAFLDQVLEHSPVPMVIFNPQGMALRANQALYTVLNLTAEQVIGKYTLQQDDNLKLKAIEEKIYQLLHHGHQISFELLWKHNLVKGVNFTGAHDPYMDVSMYPLRDNQGELTHIVCQWNDITARKAIETRISESESNLRSFINNTDESIWSFDKNYNYILFNDAYAQVFFNEYGVELKRGMNALTYLAEEHQAFWLPLTNATLNGEKKSFEFSHDFGDITRFFRTSLNPIIENGEITGVAAMSVDITDIKEAERKLRESENQLLQAQKMESVGRLAGGVAHDFNNMLGVILGHTDLMLQKLNPDSPLKPGLAEILKAGRRSSELVRQLLAFARQQTVEPKVLDLNHAVSGMINMLKRLIGEDIDLVWAPDKNLWPVKIDPSQLDQILANLCVNSRDAIKDVGKVTIETANRVFDETYCQNHPGFKEGEYSMLAVSDNGEGMENETLENVFEPFFTTKAIGKGTGLGLATVYGVIKQNNGFINVYSEPGHGTTFKIYLPRFTQDRAPLAVPEEYGDHKRDTGETVLLVEDEVSNLQLTTTILETEGYRVLPAGSPIEAIRMATEYTGSIDLLLTDVIMPEMNGRVLSEKIHSLYPDVCCIYMSGYTANVIAHHGVLEEGINFIQKPFSVNELAVKLREVLTEKSASETT